jgi:hypothetical protein
MQSATRDLFVTTLDAPPGAPWDQHRAARIAAELEAPLALNEVDIAVARIGRWRPNITGRFAAGYRRVDATNMEDCRTVSVDGQDVVLIFRSSAGEALRRRRLPTTVVLVIAVASLLTGAVVKWTHVREARAVALQQRADIARRQLIQQRHQAATVRGLALMARNDLLGRSGGQVVNDLVWLGLARDRAVSINAVRWRDRRLEIQASGRPVAGATQDTVGAWVVSPEAPKSGPSIVSRPSMRRSPP